MTPALAEIQDDTEFYEEVVGSVRDCMDLLPEAEQTEPYFEVTSVKGGTLYVGNPEHKPLPKAGDTVRFYGRGFGYSVRGVVANGTVYRYITAEQEQEAHKKQCEDRAVAKLAAWKMAAHETTARLLALPEPFQKRLAFFLRNKDWGPQFGFYELATCEAAAQLLDGKEPDEDAGLSGNMVECAEHLVAAHAQDPEYVPRAHGAMCPLVGCNEYGCFSTVSEVEELAFFGKVRKMGSNP